MSLENYNYWRDSRTISSLAGSPPWEVVSEGNRSSVVAFDYDFLENWVLGEIIEPLYQKAIEARDPIVLEYVEAKENGVGKEMLEQIDNSTWSQFFKSVEEKCLKELGLSLNEEDRWVIEVGIKYDVCGMCDGTGKVVNPSIDAGGLSQEDFYEDPDFAEGYFSGSFDVTCPDCRGKRVVGQPQLPSKLSEAVAEYEKDAWDNAREIAYERSMGC